MLEEPLTPALPLFGSPQTWGESIPPRTGEGSQTVH